jgi:predicted PurR-regulated permease PerM
VRVTSVIRSYDTDVAATPIGPPPAREGVDLDPRSVIPLAAAVAILLVGVWLVRSVPRTIGCLAIAALLALALNPLVENLQNRFGWHRRTAASVVLLVTGLVFATLIALITVPTIREAREFRDQIPKTVEDLGDLPIIGPRLREADASKKVEEWLNDVPRKLSVDATPVEDAAGTIADGVAAALLTFLLAITLLLDGELLVNGARALVPQRRKADADRIGRLVYEVVGRYIAGSLLVAVLAGTVMLTASLSLGVPLAPLIAAWVAITNPIPQIGGFLGGIVFVLLALTQGAWVGLIALVIFLVYQNLENHVLQPLIVGRAVSLSPPATMVAALIGVSAAGVIGGLFSVPLLGAMKAIYLSTRRGVEDPLGISEEMPKRRRILGGRRASSS